MQFLTEFDEIQFLMDHDLVIPNDIFRIACKDGETEMVKFLLKDNRVNPENDNKAIHLASMNGHIEVVRLLLADKRINPKCEDGITLKIKLFGGVIKEYDTVVIDNTMYTRDDDCDVKIIGDGSIEKYYYWKYRIGGEKYNQAKIEIMG